MLPLLHGQPLVQLLEHLTNLYPVIYLLELFVIHEEAAKDLKVSVMVFLIRVPLQLLPLPQKL